LESLASLDALLLSLVLTLVTAVFLFDLNWVFFGPALIILTGIGIVVNALVDGRE